jgi:hypothetical protein
VKPELRPEEVLDAAQVRTLVTKFAGDDDAGRLGVFFEKPDLQQRRRAGSSAVGEDRASRDCMRRRRATLEDTGVYRFSSTHAAHGPLLWRYQLLDRSRRFGVGLGKSRKSGRSSR